MTTEARKYFKYLHLVREDVQEEFEQLGIHPRVSRVCDFACGSGISTFALALELAGAECFGVDLFGQEWTPQKLSQYIRLVKRQCQSPQSTWKRFPVDLCKLVLEERAPQFLKGDIVANQNLPGEFDLAYCKKLLVNLLGEEPIGGLSGERRLLLGLKHITQSIRPGGLLCVIEYDKDFRLAQYLERGELCILKQTQIRRREIRSRGRTHVISTFALYLCQRVERSGSPTAA